MKQSKVAFFLISLLLVASVFVGCSATASPTAAPASTTAPAAFTTAPADTSSAASTASAAPAAQVKTIIIGTGNAFKPYCYLDENGNLQGYEKAVLDAVNAKLPQYKFEYQTFDFKNVLISLDASKIDIGAHQFEVNPERQAKFLYGSVPYTTFILRIVVKKGRTDIKSLDDLAGKKLQVGEGSNDSYVVGQYNAAHGNKINVITNSADAATTVKSIENGTIDAFISIKRIVDSYNQTYGDVLETVGDPISTSNTYFIFRKDETQLQQDVDKALQALKDDGTLAKISTEILGADYTSND